jgi:hypothetical protein
MNAATAWGRVNAEFTDRFSSNSVTCNDVVLLFLFRQDLYPGGGVWKLIELLKLLKSFSVEEFQRNFDCLIN